MQKPSGNLRVVQCNPSERLSPMAARAQIIVSDEAGVLWASHATFLREILPPTVSHSPTTFIRGAGRSVTRPTTTSILNCPSTCRLISSTEKGSHLRTPPAEFVPNDARNGKSASHEPAD